jgi:hypothetical protein
MGGRGSREERAATKAKAEAAARAAADETANGARRTPPTTTPAEGQLPELVVAASGNLALVFFPRLPGRVTLEQLDEQWPGLAASLAAHPGVGFIMVRSAAHGAVALGARGANYLDEGRIEGEDPVAKYGEHAVTGLRRVDGMAHCGDIVAISLLDDETDEVAAFEELIGSHGGLGGPQTQPFILHPAEWSLDEPLVGAESVYRQIRRWLSGVGIELGKQPTLATGDEAAPAKRPEVEAVEATLAAHPPAD